MSRRKKEFFSSFFLPLFALPAASEPDLWALSYATSSTCIVNMVSGLDWVGLGGSAAAVGVNDLRWGVCTLEHGVQLYT